MSPPDGVAVGLMMFCLDDDSALLRDVIVDYAVCGGLLVDLALAGRLTDTSNSVEVDASPTGFPVTDRLLADVVENPDRTIDWWLRRGGIGQRDVADSLVDAGRWSRIRGLRVHARFEDCNPDLSSGYRANVLRVAQTGLAPDATTAATAVLAIEARLIPADGVPRRSVPRDQPRPGDGLVQQCGVAADLVNSLVDYLHEARLDLAAVASATGSQIAMTNFIR